MEKIVRPKYSLININFGYKILYFIKFLSNSIKGNGKLLAICLLELGQRDIRYFINPFPPSSKKKSRKRKLRSKTISTREVVPPTMRCLFRKEKCMYSTLCRQCCLNVYMQLQGLYKVSLVHLGNLQVDLGNLKIAMRQIEILTPSEKGKNIQKFCGNVPIKMTSWAQI